MEGSWRGLILHTLLVVFALFFPFLYIKEKHVDLCYGPSSESLSRLSLEFSLVVATAGLAQSTRFLISFLWGTFQVAGAHACYLVADASFEPFSENARLCLVGADHFKWQRTFATPSSIQVLLCQIHMHMPLYISK